MVIGADGVATQKAVKTGITDGHDTQILSGLAAGDKIALRDPNAVLTSAQQGQEKKL